MILWESDPLLGTVAHHRVGHALVSIQKPLSRRSATSVIPPRDIPLSARPIATELGVLQLQPF